MQLAMGGRHNLLNALGAAGAARVLGADWPSILSAIEKFGGVGRRFEHVGEVGGVLVIDDYAHHPTELAATLRAAHAMFPDRNLVAVFQPHLFSRTRDFARQFGEALSIADAVFVTDVFPAREEPIPGITGQTIADAVVVAGGKSVEYIEALDDVAEAVVGRAAYGDVVMTLGAGSIERVGSEIVARLGAPIHA